MDFGTVIVFNSQITLITSRSNSNDRNSRSGNWCYVQTVSCIGIPYE